jgi:hypothetical protein
LGRFQQDGGEQSSQAWVRLRNSKNFMEAWHVQSLSVLRGISMKRHLRKLALLILIAGLALARPVSVQADEGEGEHGLEAEVNGYHLTLSSQSEWVKGENVVVVTITDATGMPVSDAEVEILIAPKQADSHGESESDSHGEAEPDAHTEPEADPHGSEPSHDSKSNMDAPEEESTDLMAHDEETVTPLVMTESHEHGAYVAEAHLEKAGAHIVQVFFHVNDEMMQADFIVDVPGASSKTVVLWSFLLINIALVVTAGFMKNQTVTVKGK